MKTPEYVYVGGVIGRTPYVASRSLELAMLHLLSGHKADSDIRERGYPEQWACTFIDGEPDTGLLCTLTMTDSDGHESQLYVRCVEIVDDYVEYELGEGAAPS